MNGEERLREIEEKLFLGIAKKKRFALTLRDMIILCRYLNQTREAREKIIGCDKGKHKDCHCGSIALLAIKPPEEKDG